MFYESNALVSQPVADSAGNRLTDEHDHEVDRDEQTRPAPSDIERAGHFGERNRDHGRVERNERRREPWPFHIGGKPCIPGLLVLGDRCSR